MENPEIRLIETLNGHQHTHNQKGKTTWTQKTAFITNEKISIGFNYQMVDYKNKKTTSLFPTQWKEKRLIVIFTNPDKKLNSELMKNYTNNIFKMTNVNVTMSIIVKTITESKKTVTKTMENNNADDLIKHQHVWKPNVKPCKIAKNEIWHKILAHGINIKFSKNMHALK